MSNKIHRVVLVLKTGGDFNFSDVQLLAFHICKQWKGEGDLDIICLCNEVSAEYRLKGVTLLPMYNKDWPKWWSKMNLFAPEIEKYRPFLYVDLDTAVVGSLEGILPPINKEQFITLGGFNPEVEMYLLSGMMWFPENSKKVQDVWDEWIKDPNDIMERYKGGDQEFIKHVIKAPDVYWQRLVPNRIFNGKPRGERMINNGRDAQPILWEVPRGASIICFHGWPKIPEAAKYVGWIRRYVMK